MGRCRWIALLLALVCAPGTARAVSFVRGDANVDGAIDVSDPVRVLGYLFAGSPVTLDCEDAADANDDELVDLADAVTLLARVFTSSAPLPSPSRCGADPGGATLGCVSYPPCPGLQPGTLTVQWLHGAPSCQATTDPPLQVHAYNEDTFILRQSKCVHFEAPFLYLLFGTDKVLLEDTGATSSASLFPVRATVQAIITQWLLDHGQTSIQLIVAHSHGHGDHTAGDAQFVGQHATTVVGTSQSAVASFFGITSWPTQIVAYDLGGGRILDVIPIPGHQSAHIAIYDRQTGLLLTGDTLYPGYLFLSASNFPTFAASIQRLVDFTATRPVAHILGTHVEMTSTPGVAYPYGSTYQPMEHVLQLTLADLLLLHTTAQAMLANPQTTVLDSFIITL